MHPLLGPVAVPEMVSSSSLPKNRVDLLLRKLLCEYKSILISALKSLPMPVFAIMQNRANSSFLALKVLYNV